MVHVFRVIKPFFFVLGNKVLTLASQAALFHQLPPAQVSSMWPVLISNKAQTLDSVRLASTQSAATDEPQPDDVFFFCLLLFLRSGSVHDNWGEIYSFVKNLTDRFVR